MANSIIVYLEQKTVKTLILTPQTNKIKNVTSILRDPKGLHK